MQRPHLRPRLEILVHAPLQQVRAELQRRLAASEARFRFDVRRQHLHVEMAGGMRRWWSPALDLSLREHPEGTQVLGRFGPHPDFWTLYVFLYAAAGFVAVLAGSLALGQLAMGVLPIGLLGLGGAGGIALLAWASARLGAHWGHEQMRELLGVAEGLGELRRDDANVGEPRHESEQTTSQADLPPVVHADR